jgi:hypothetical protein
MSFLPLYPLPLREREGKGEGEPERRGNLYFWFSFIVDYRKARVHVSHHTFTPLLVILNVVKNP